MTPAEKRVKDLIDRWQTSLDLHLQYVDLKDTAYNNVQPWPVHDRPTRWVLEVAKQKTLELQAAFESRLSMGDAKFADSVELIVFLSNLVGLQHVQRFIPMAEPDRHGAGTLTELDGLKAVKAPGKQQVSDVIATPPRTVAPVPTLGPAAVVSKAPVKDDDATREMPRPARASPPVQKAEDSPASSTPAAAKPAAGSIDQLVVEDAVRLINWGRSWHEIAELVARIADRPKTPEVRKILRSHRAEIDRRVAAEKEKAEEEKKGGKK